MSNTGDHVTLLTVYTAFLDVPARERAGWCRDNFLNMRSLSKAQDIDKQLRGHLESIGMKLGESLRVSPAGSRPSRCRGNANACFPRRAHRRSRGLNDASEGPYGRAVPARGAQAARWDVQGAGDGANGRGTSFQRRQPKQT